jgi:DNA-binding CsgD family transcriptional regulator
MVLQITPWERDALQLLAAGVADDEIAAVLGISEGTVNSYLAYLFEKLGVTSRSEAVMAATRRGLALVANQVALAVDDALNYGALQQSLALERERQRNLEASDELVRALTTVLDIRHVFRVSRKSRQRCFRTTG